MKYAFAVTVTLALTACATLPPPYTAKVPEKERYAEGYLSCRTGTLGLGPPRSAQVQLDRWAGTAKLKRPGMARWPAPWERFQLRETAERGVYATTDGKEMLQLTRRGARVQFPGAMLNCRWDGNPPYRLSSTPGYW